MTGHTPEVTAARQTVSLAAEALAQAPAFQQLDAVTQAALTRDLQRIQQALENGARQGARHDDDPYALSLAGPADLMRQRLAGSQTGQPPAEEPRADVSDGTRRRRATATETLAARTGALIDEVDFPGFISSLVVGAYDAMVTASIRQMEAYANLVSSVAQDVDRFTSENVTSNQVRDWLVERYPADVELDFSNGQPRLKPRPTANDEYRTPVWLDDFGLQGEELSEELLEEQIIPAARQRIGLQRMQQLSAMVLLGLNRIYVRDGTISAKVRFRAAARDRARVDFAQSMDPGGVGATWGSRGTVNQASMMVSTVGANVQADTELRAELFGEVRINFASETLPLETFADAAQTLLLERNARPASQPASLVPVATAPTGEAPPRIEEGEEA